MNPEPLKPVRPPQPGEARTEQIHLLVTPAQKKAWLLAKGDKSLLNWIFENLDRAANYKPEEK